MRTSGGEMADEENGRIWKLVLSYDGTEFHGWQVQPERATVQGELRAAIQRVTGEEVLPQGAGRTDAGVHAIGQVASFALQAPIPEENFARALNRTLPAAIRVLTAQHAPRGFHARHSARGKTYEYRIVRGEICPPFLARYVYALTHSAPSYRLDFDAMRRAAKRVVGEHGFTSFAASDPERDERGPAAGAERANNLRIISCSEWTRGPALLAKNPQDVNSHDVNPQEMDLLTYRVQGNGFLHHMVRNLVGTFLEVGRGNLGEEEISRILEARTRASAGPTAPGRGLFLIDVQY
jgi:tRNA pseudouridine38-40 synthase